MALETASRISVIPKQLDLRALAQSGRFSVAPATEAELPFLAEMMVARIGDLRGSYPAFERVHRHSRSVLTVKNEGRAVGCFSALVLNQRGFKSLLAGSLSIAEPEPSDLAGLGEAAFAIYVWAVCVPKIAVRATANAIEWLRQAGYATTDFYARPGTPEGEAFMARLGFELLLGL